MGLQLAHLLVLTTGLKLVKQQVRDKPWNVGGGLDSVERAHPNTAESVSEMVHRDGETVVDMAG
jgi:hypothetical protein